MVLTSGQRDGNGDSNRCRCTLMYKTWLRDLAGPRRGESAHDYAKRQILHWTQHDEMVQLGKKGRAVPPLTQEEIDLIDDRLGRGEALPPELSEKVVAIVRRPAGKRGPDPGALVSRDVMIRWTIANLVRHCGLNPTRKRSTTKTESA